MENVGDKRCFSEPQRKNIINMIPIHLRLAFLVIYHAALNQQRSIKRELNLNIEHGTFPIHMITKKLPSLKSNMIEEFLDEAVRNC